MSKGKLLELFAHLDESQLRKLKQFVRSPIFNRHQQVIGLFEWLRKHKNGQLARLTDEATFAHLFPTEAFEVAKLNHLKNYLVRVIEEFLSWSAADGSPLQKSRLLSDSLVLMGMDGQANKQLKKAKNILDQSHYRDESFFRNQYEVNLRGYELQMKSGKRNRDFNLQGLNDSLDISYIAEKLKVACILLAHQSVAKQEYDTGLLDFLNSFLKGHPYLEEPTIGIYYYGYLSLTQPDRLEELNLLIDRIHIHAHLFKNADLINIYLIAINGCIRRLNKGHPEYIRKVFELYRSGLERKVFFKNGMMTAWTYKNVAAAGLSLKEFDWVHDFIYEYKAYLPQEEQEPYFHFNLAKYYFEQKAFDKAMPLLSKEEYADLLTNLSAKIMLTKMYYEQGEFEALTSLLGSMKKYIYRKKILGYHKDHYLAIIGYIQKMLDIAPSDRRSRDALRGEISQSSVSEKEWLLEQLDNLR